MSGGGNLRDIPRRRPRPDPEGKAALFSAAPRPDEAPDVTRPTATQPDATPPSDRQPQPGTMLLECGDCGTRSRVTWFDFAVLSLPVPVWLPLPGLQFNRLITCPACRQRTWVRVHWFS